MPLKKVHKVYGTQTKKLYEPPEFYNEIRPVGHVPTEEELRYFSNDLTVLAEALRAHINIYGLTIFEFPFVSKTSPTLNSSFALTFLIIG